MRINEWSREALQHVLDAADNATQEEWVWGHSGTTTRQGAFQYSRDMIERGIDDDLHGVFVDRAGVMLCVALTGNGPTSEANARYLNLVEPANIHSLVTELVRTRNEVARLTRLLDAYNSID